MNARVMVMVGLVLALGALLAGAAATRGDEEDLRWN